MIEASISALLGPGWTPDPFRLSCGCPNRCKENGRCKRMIAWQSQRYWQDYARVAQLATMRFAQWLTNSPLLRSRCAALMRLDMTRWSLWLPMCERGASPGTYLIKGPHDFAYPLFLLGGESLRSLSHG